MKKWLAAVLFVCLFVFAGCSRPEPEKTVPAETETESVEAPTEEETSGIKVIENAGPDKDKTISLRIVDRDNPALPGRVPEKVR